MTMKKIMRRTVAKLLRGAIGTMVDQKVTEAFRAEHDHNRGLGDALTRVSTETADEMRRLGALVERLEERITRLEARLSESG
jgi:hypothetical protein